ncbi:cytochrome c4 [Methylonatrum kenyense]|uniref:c-type cytochrome n=1 Tax=Methylonatrum kenyense TaxID=455253 RepID=UPI0020C1733D|nr:cytochrome c4 [Methylonatrum kenyense]MCK8515034.1 cytochrome c4 [Methylonatrum kenyense]
MLRVTTRYCRTILVVAALLGLAPSGHSLAADEVSIDTMEQRIQPCMACHAEKGIDLQAGFVPSLHGKPAGYLFNQLMNYRDGRRDHRAMEYMVRNLSPDYLREIAEYFAGLEGEYPEPAAEPSSAAMRDRADALITRGDPERDVPACIACHGARLTGAEPNTPSLLALPSHYVAAQMTSWRSGQRQAAEPDCMHTIAERLSSEDIYALARALAAQDVPSNREPESEPLGDLPMDCGSVPMPES